jgi:uncharacterized membrane protein
VRKVWNRIRRAFLTGLLIGVPIGVTIWVGALLVSFLESAIHLVPRPYQPENLLGFKIPGLGILLALSTTMALGLAAESVVGRWIIGLYERILARVPGLSSVYVGVKQLMQQLFQSEKGFERVVLIQWPRPGTYSIAFHTGEAFIDKEGEQRMVNLFLPTTPNFTTGFYFMASERELIPTHLTMEDAFKLLMSAGLVEPPSRMTLPADVTPQMLGQGNHLVAPAYLEDLPVDPDDTE